MRGETKLNCNSILIEASGVRPIAFNPELAQIANSAIAGLFLSQLLYWNFKGKNDPDWMYKTIKEMHEETHLNRSEQDRCIKIWKELGVIEIKLKGIPAKRHFHINLEQLLFLHEQVTGEPLLFSAADEFAECRKLHPRFKQTITESTQEITNINGLFQSTYIHSDDVIPF